MLWFESVGCEALVVNLGKHIPSSEQVHTVDWDDVPEIGRGISMIRNKLKILGRRPKISTGNLLTKL